MLSKIALVTGANGGLGTHVTKALLDASFTVAGLAPQIQQSDLNHPNFIALPAALTSPNDAKKAVECTIAHRGKIDVLSLPALRLKLVELRSMDSRGRLSPHESPPILSC